MLWSESELRANERANRSVGLWLLKWKSGGLPLRFHTRMYDATYPSAPMAACALNTATLRSYH